MMILLKSHDRLIIANGIGVVRRLVDGGQKNLIARYFVVLVIATHELPDCVLKYFDSYEQACKYLKAITWEITKCSGNYVFYMDDYPRPLDDSVRQYDLLSHSRHWR